MKIKKLFSTPLKASLTIMSLMAIIAILSTGTVYAAGAIAQNSSIGEENAKKFSFADAGIDPATAKAVQIEFDYEQGQYVYEIEFIADDREYEYWINASDGTVVKKEIELVALNGANEVTSAQITLEKAKEIALSDVKLAANAVTFTTAKLDKEDNISVYELEFYAENVEYEYEINASNGSIYSKSKEIIADKKKQALSEKAQQPTKSETKETTAKAKQDNTNNANNTNNTNNKNNKNKATESATDKQQAAKNLITLDAAKAKALADADVTAANVTYTEAKLDYEDGIAVYEIEFYSTTHEYEYEINAATGAVHDKSVEAHKNNKGKGQAEKGDTGNTGNTGNYLGIGKAKSIAVSHAGLSISDVTFSKAKLDTDDGNTVYDIKFYKDGIEYEYEIDASSGKILEYESEQED